MVYPPGQSMTIRDGGVGLVSTATALPLIMGVTSGGVADTLYQFTDPNEASDTVGDGPAAELALATINAAGGCLLLKTQASTAGSNGSVTPTRVGTSTGTITVAGTPRDSYEVEVQITATGTLGAGRFKYTLDDGYTFSAEYTIPAGGSFALPDTGLTLTFVPGAGPIHYEKGDRHAFDATAPLYTTADLSAAFTALLAQIGPRRIRQVFLSGKHASAADAATMAAAFATHLATLETNKHYARGIMDAGLDTPANVLTSFAAFADDRVAVVYGDADVVSLNAKPGWGVPKLPALNPFAERAAVASLSENIGRYLSGALRGVRAISHDEGRSTQFSETAKINTLRTHPGSTGFYVTNGYLKSPAGSDFLYYDWGRTIDEICETVEEAQQKWILAKLRSLTDGTGKLDPKDGARVEAAVRAALKARLLDPINAEGQRGHVSGLAYSVDLTNDFLGTRQLRSTTAAVPLSPVEEVASVVGFTRSL